MSQRQVFTNTFINGMRVDVDPHIAQNTTYRFAIGARLAWNESNDQGKTLEQNTKDGVSLAICNARGNRFEIALCSGYKYIGSINSNKGTLLFLTDGTNSEIGYFELNDNIYGPNHVKYTTLFNDKFDPNGDKLNFSIHHYAHGFFVDENEFAERYYWTDAYNQERVINRKLFYNTDGTPIHNQGCNATSSYPKHLSVHAFDQRMDLVFPRLKYSQRIPGKMKSGQVQLVMKYLSKNGHSSVWSPLSRPVFVTDQKLDGDINIGGVNYANPYRQNHHNRTMGASNIMTEEGMRWEVAGLDQRWDQVVIGYVYHTSEVAFQEANQYKIYDITGHTLTVDLLAHTGIGISKEELNQRFETILSSGSIAQQENRKWSGNVELLPDMSLDFSNVKIEPQVRYYRPDNTVEPTFQEVFNPVSGRNDNDPITNTFLDTVNMTMTNFTGDTEFYGGGLDYINYKGQLFNFLFKGYFRGETQPFAFLWLDRKGNPLFAQHMTDYTFPNQFDSLQTPGNGKEWPWTLSRKNVDNSFDLRIMGAKVSNITIPYKLLYDKFGKLNVSGFMIVRTERSRRIANQGILFNANVSLNGDTNTDSDVYVHPMEGITNEYDLLPTSTNAIFPESYYYRGALGSNYNGNGPNSESVLSPAAAGIFNYHSPDLLIEQKIGYGKISETDMLSGRMQKIGFVHQAYSEKIDLYSANWYTKTYQTIPVEFLDEIEKIKRGRAKVGSESRIRFAIIHDQNSLHIYSKYDPETADKADYRVALQANFPPSSIIWKSTQEPYSVIMKLLDWKLIDSILSPSSKTTFAIVNWKISSSEYYTSNNESSLETRRYFSTGHFQPITQEILDKSYKTYNPDDSVKYYTFNDIDVWGGDCYVNLFDFTRLYPEYGDCVKDSGSYIDYSHSMIVPIESKYNLSLLFGRKFAANGVMPQRTSCEGGHPNLSNGIKSIQPEDWSYNTVLQLEENTKFYFPKPSDIKIIQKRESSIFWTGKKVYGEKEDTFRQQLPLDYGDLIGAYGKITKLVNSFNSLYVVQEHGFGILETNLKSIIPSDSGDLFVRSADVFSGCQYYSKTFGSQHPNSVWIDDSHIGFCDANKGKILVFAQNGLSISSDEDGQHDPISQKTIYFDKQIIHDPGNWVDIIAAMDFENNSVTTSFIHDTPNITIGGPDDRVNELDSFSLTYSRQYGVFHGNEHFKGKAYFNCGRYLLGMDPSAGNENKIYLYNHGKYGQWFGAYFPTIIEFDVNPQSNVAKTFDLSFANLNFDAYQRLGEIKLQVNNNVHYIYASVNNGTSIIFEDDRVQYIEDSLRIPLHEYDWLGLKTRLRGHVLSIRLVIENKNQQIDGKDLRVSLTNFDTCFRISHPMQY